MTKSVLGIIGGSGIYDLPGLGEGEEPAAIKQIFGASRRRRCASARSPGCRWSSCRVMTPATVCRRQDINCRANIDVLKRAGRHRFDLRCRLAAPSRELPPGTFVLVDQFVDRTYKRESSFFGKGLVKVASRWRIRCRRGCASISPRPRWPRINPGGARRQSRVRRGPAVLLARREPAPTSSIGYSGDRHDQHAGGEARPRGWRSVTRPSRW